MVEQLQQRIEQLTDAQRQLQRRIELLETRVPAPQWFIDEFGSADLGGLIRDPHFTPEGWRSMAVVLRAMQRPHA